MKILVILLILVACQKKETTTQTSAKKPTLNELNRKKTPIFSTNDISPEGFNWVHYDLALIYSGTIYEHRLEGKVRLSVLQSRKPNLESYLLSHTKITKPQFLRWNQNKRISFLLNTYHATLLNLMAAQNSLVLKPEVFDNPKTVLIFQKQYSLNEFIKSELEPTYKNPYIYYALKCFAPTCPEFRNSIYNFKNIEGMLQVSAKRFFMDESKFIFDPKTSTLSLPKIFNDYAPLKKLSSEELKKQLLSLSESAAVKTAINSGKLKIKR